MRDSLNVLIIIVFCRCVLSVIILDMVSVLQAAPAATQGGGWAVWVLPLLIVMLIIFIVKKLRKNVRHSVELEPRYSEYNDRRSYRCFIAGSTALQNERDAIRAVIGEIHNRWSSKNIYITSYTFEDFNNNVQVGGLQNQYDRFIAHDADCIIFIVDGEIGDKTLHEFNIALKVYGEKRRPSIYVYNNVNGKSHPQADTFINKVAREGHYWRLYSNVMDLRLKFKEDITNELIGKYV